MQVRLRKAALASAVTVLIGVGVFLYALANYRLGTFSRVDSGMFPTILGVVLVFVGGLIYLTDKDADQLSISMRPLGIFAQIILSVLAFAAIAPRFGLVPAVAVMAILSMLGLEQLKPLEILLSTLVQIGMAVVVFHYALGVPFVLVRWPF